jgi:hypothetical protein
MTGSIGVHSVPSNHVPGLVALVAILVRAAVHMRRSSPTQWAEERLMLSSFVHA